MNSTNFCCMCSGICAHSGPHSYCDKHGTGEYISQWPPIPVYPMNMPLPCEHCFCQKCDDKGYDKKEYNNHKKCCMCGHRKLI